MRGRGIMAVALSGERKPARAFKDGGLMAAVVLGVFLTYAATSYPTVAPRDAGDLATAAVTLGVAHPPGYPLYSVLGKAWTTLLPAGDPAYRLNLLSAACGALAAGALFSLVALRAGPWAGLAAGLGLAWSLPLWKFSLLCEMYSLHALLCVVLLGLASGPRTRGRLFLSALLFGLGLVNHQTMLLLAPALAWMWRREVRHWPAAVPFLVLGLALYGFLWVRLGDAGAAWAAVTRAEYGIFELFGPFTRPFSAGLMRGLLAHFGSGLVTAVGWPSLVLAVLGGRELWVRDRDLGMGTALAFLATGPVYLFVTRFDVSDWIVRSVLETAFIIPAAMVCLVAGYGIAWFSKVRPGPVAACLSIVAASGALAGHVGRADHRDDFLAYDYVRNLENLLPPDSSAVVAGDTALFGLRYRAAVDRVAPVRDIMGIGSPGFQKWFAGWRMAVRDHNPVDDRRFYAVGVGLERLREFDVWGGLLYPWPQGLVTRLRPDPPFYQGYWPQLADAEENAAWEVAVLRRPRALAAGDSYSRGVVFSHAYARYLAGVIRESFAGDPETLAPAERHFLHAVSLDPDTYALERVPVRPGPVVPEGAVRPPAAGGGVQ